jgi:putative membrane protein
MALVLGIYPRLLAALAALTQGATWRALLSRDARRAWAAIDGLFVLSLASGIALAVIGLAGVVESALEVARPQVYALFAGMIVASTWLLARSVDRWRPGVALLLLMTATLALMVVQFAPMRAPEGVGFLVLSGAIGISALLLPGISGAFLLVLLGQYEVILGAIARGDLVTLAPFALGAAVGLLSASRLLHHGWRRFPDATHAAMTGFLIGSLPRLWPWQPEGAERLALLAPMNAGAGLLGLGLLLFGASLVLGLQHYARRSNLNSH